MAIDANGNNVAAVGIPVTGFLGFAPSGTAFPTPAAGATVPLSPALDAAFKKAGLLTEDGGFQWTLEPDGDAIEFFQDGYSIPSGLANVTLVVKLAQYDDYIRGLIYGAVPDGNGYITIDGSGTTNRYVIFTEEIFKSGMIRRRVAADAGIIGIALDQDERGSVNGIEVTFKVARSALLANKHIGEWLIPAAAGVVPVITTALPSGQGAGQLVTLTGTGFTGATGVKFGATNSAGFFIDSDTSIRAILPPGSAGTANATVINAVGTSNAAAYTRVV